MADILLVHGLWNRGWMMASMAKRLRERGHHVRVFSYPTRAADLDGHADALRQFILEESTDELQLIGHSMGGLVILNMLSRYDDLPPGRIVLMGTPVKGSHVVKNLEKLPGHKILFGKSRENLLQGFEFSPRARETGMIRGTRAFGLGQIAGAKNEPNDGTVKLSETEMEGLADKIDLEVSHSEMLISSVVVEQAEQFLLHGRFKKKY